MYHDRYCHFISALFANPFSPGVIIGYCVYLITTLFTGELIDNTIDFIILYFPRTEGYFEERLSIRKSVESARRTISKDPNATANGMSLPEEGPRVFANNQALFDDHHGDQGHIVHADMAMGTTETGGPDVEPPRPSQAFADFGLDFTPAATNTKNSRNQRSQSTGSTPSGNRLFRDSDGRTSNLSANQPRGNSSGSNPFG